MTVRISCQRMGRIYWGRGGICAVTTKEAISPTNLFVFPSGQSPQTDSMMKLFIISEDLKKIVSSTIESIKEGLKGKEAGVLGPIEFELAVVKAKEAAGGFRFFIADASGNYSKESLSKIKFSVVGTRTRDTGLLWLKEST